MKAARQHRVPLPAAAVPILRQVRALDAIRRYIFPGRQCGKQMSKTALLMALGRMETETTARGFGSSFGDCTDEND